MCDGAILDDYLLGDLLRYRCVLYDGLLDYSHRSNVFLYGLLNDYKWLALDVVVDVVVVVIIVVDNDPLLLVILCLE